MAYDPLARATRGHMTGAAVLVAPSSSWYATPRRVRKYQGLPSTTVQFFDTSTGYISAWLWDFGDGTTSALQNPTHQYNATGKFTISLTVTGAPGVTHTLTQDDYITVRLYDPGYTMGVWLEDE